MSKIRILEVSKSTGGLSTYMHWIAQDMDRSRFELIFVCLSTGSIELAKDLARFYGAKTYSWSMNRYKINPFTDMTLVIRLFRLIRSEGVQIVHAHGSKAGFITRLAAIGSNIPVIYSPHNFAFHDEVPRWKAHLYAFFERIAAKFLTAKIMTVSNGEREMAARFKVGTPELFETVHSGVNPSDFDGEVNFDLQRYLLGIPPEVRLVGTVGRLNEQKNPLDFIRLAAYINKKEPEVYFVWIGDGPLAMQARKLAAELGLEKVMRFTGSREDIVLCLKVFDVFVMCSKWEAFSLALLEAMASRLPIVAFNLPGIAEAVRNGVSGCLVPSGDIAGMSASILSILSDREFSKQLGLKARENIELNFTRAEMLENIMRIYESVFLGANQ